MATKDCAAAGELAAAIPELLITKPGQPPAVCRVAILAHGAGAAMDTAFMDFFADALAAAGATVVRFEFPYMAGRRVGGSKRPPDRQPVLLDCWRAVIGEVRQRFAPQAVYIGGKSMGGRMASLIADQQGVDGVFALGFPFHAPGKPEGMAKRVAHLATLKTPALFCQGTRDTLGSRETCSDAMLSPQVVLRWIEDGDHSLTPRKSSGLTQAQAWRQAAEALVEFMAMIPASSP